MENLKILAVVNNKIMFNSTWYDLLIKPPLNPPAGIFLPVWIFMYTAIFVSLILFIIRYSRTPKTKGIILFVLHMILNVAWSPIFFGLKNIGFALVILILMVITGILVLVEFYKVSRLSSYILIPYFLWICFALYLNTGFFILN